MTEVNLLLAAGACFSEETFNKCALQPSDCGSGEVYRSSRWLLENDSTVSNTCSMQKSILALKNLGRCNGTADRFICTSDKTACRFAAVFEPNADDCNLIHDFYEDNEFTNAHYGFCFNRDDPGSDFCTWSFQECGGSATDFDWHGADPFFADSNPECHCDDVRTGACVDSTNANPYCAVSSEVCDTDLGYTYLKVLDLQSELLTECNLCSTLSDDDLKHPGGDDTSSNNPSTNTLGGGTTVSTTSSTNAGEIVGIVVGVILGVVVLIAVGMAVRMRRKKARRQKEEAFQETDVVQEVRM